VPAERQLFGELLEQRLAGRIKDRRRHRI
jgi:hypothetical protein